MSRLILVPYRLFSCFLTRKCSDKSTYLRATPALVVLFITFCLISCTTPGGREVGDVYDDTVIAAKVKGRLTEMMGAKVIGVDVDVYQGEVTLQGRVRSPNMESRVVAVAAQVPGVRKVINLLKILP
jgi:hypothetical protein